MALDDELREVGEEAKDTYAEGKKNIKNAWADTKAGAEKAKNNAEAEIDKM